MLQALRCLVSILKSMAAWHNSATTNAAAAAAGAGGEPGPAASAAAVGGSGATVADEVATADESVIKSGWMAKMAESGVAPSASESAAAAAVPEGDQRQAALLESWKGYKRQFQQGVTLFNQKPKKGIAYMQEHGLVGPTAEDVSQFLARTQGLK